MSFNVIGVKTSPDKLATQKATGKHDFSTDHDFEGLLYARALGSPYPHAKITAIDSSAVLALPGVKAVTTYQDCPVLSQELFYGGQEVALVAATDPHIADQAVELFNVTYQQLPFVTDALAAAKSGAPLVGVVPNSNIIGSPTVISWGDADAGLAASDVTVTDTVGWSAGYQHSTLQARACIAVWDQSTQGGLTIYTNSQDVFSMRANFAGALGLPLTSVTVISHGTGGAQGDLQTQGEWCIMAAVLAKKAGAPVKYNLSRRENYLNATHQYPDYATISIGAMNDGTINAIEGTFYSDVGAMVAPMVGDAISPLELTFNVPNAKFTGYSVVTNKPRCYAWRCVGEPGGLFDMDPIIEQLCTKLSMDPVQFRVKNVKTINDTDNGTGKNFTSMALAECLNTAATTIGWSSKWHKPGTKVLSDGRYHGIGVSGFVCNKGAYSSDNSTMIVTSTTGGQFLAFIGHTGIQQSPSAQTSIVAEALGVNEADVQIGDYGNTSTTQNCGNQGGSTRIITAGTAGMRAGQDLLSQLFALAAPMLNTTADKLSAAKGQIYLTSDPTKFVTHAQVLATAPPLVGIGRATPYTDKVVRTDVACCAEVAVDTETGAVEVLNIVDVDDLGRAIHWMGAVGQIDGGTVFDVGQELFWSQITDPQTGFVVNPSYLDQKFPTIMDVPLGSNCTSIPYEAVDSFGPYGAKGLAEPSLGTQHVAISNAIYNATGFFVRQQPADPRAVLKALGKSM